MLVLFLFLGEHNIISIGDVNLFSHAAGLCCTIHRPYGRAKFKRIFTLTKMRPLKLINIHIKE